MSETGKSDRERAREWWRTAIIDIHPGVIRVRGYPIEQLIGRVDFPTMVWLILRGELPAPGEAELLGAALVAAVDHGPQAPSIATARMAATCGVGLNNAVASGINALGDVHGGAGAQTMELFANIAARVADDEGLEPAVRAVLGDYPHRHVPGFGHRFHPVDPRTPRLLALVDRAAAAGMVSGRFAAIGRTVETALAVRRHRPIPMNIDGVTAVIFLELGFPPSLGRGLFILSRSVGILAHAWEESQEGGRIKGPIPPDFLYAYTGPPPREVPGAGSGEN